jgi:uncharacterized delta-60 repeat protein
VNFLPAFAAILSSLLLAVAIPARAGPGDADLSFGVNGVARVAFAPAPAEGRVLRLQADGKAVVAAQLSDGLVIRVGLARFNVDGSPDPAFGAGGRIVHELPPGAGVTTTPHSLFELAGGKLLLVGFSNFNAGVLLARFNPDGTLDATFGTGGVATPAVGIAVFEAALQADGKIVVAGYGYPPGASTQEGLVARLNADGTLDATFGNSSPGLSKLSVGTGDDYAATLAIQPDGKIFVAGYSSIGGNMRMVAWRLDSTGTTDFTFGCASPPCSGSVTFPALGFLTLARSAAVLGDGRILVAGFDYINAMLVARLNPNGTLDATFGCNPGCLGYALATMPGYAPNAEDMVLLADGRIVLAGYGNNGPQNRAAIARFTADGTLDETLGPGGVKTFVLGASDQFWAAALQLDGKVLLAGTVTAISSDAAILRLGADFAVDAGYGAAGLASASFPVPTAAEAVAVQPDGRIVAAGTANAATLDFGVARWNADGALDTAFGCASPPCTGRTTVPVLTRTDSAHALLAQPDGRIVVAGGAVDGSTGQYPTAIARLNADGTPDTTFGCASPPCLGRNVIDFPGSVVSAANAVARQPDGKLVVAGSSRPGSYFDFAVARFQANGTLDPDFGCATPGTCSGRTQFDMAGFDDEAFAVAVLPDGRILVAGEAGAVPDRYYDFAVIRLNANGTVDNTFGTAGRAFVDFGSVFPGTLYRDTAYAMHVQPDGAIVLAGRSQLSSGGANRFVVARLLADGSPDAGFGTAGTVIVAAPDDAQARAVVGLADGRLLVAGHYLNGATRDIAVVALTATGALDATFGASGVSTIAAGARDDLAFSAALTGDEQLVIGARSDDLMTVVRLDTRGRATVSLAATANPTLAGQPANFTATLSGGSGFTGTVAFLDGGAPIAGCTAVAVTGATAECTTSALAAGQHGIVARYSGDATRHASSSASLSHSVGEVFTLTVAKDGNATGTVTSEPAGIACGMTCAVLAGSGAVYTLTATPDANAVFAGWSGGGCSGAGTCVVTLDAAKTVTATFTLQPHELSVGKTGNGAGTVSSTPAGIDCGAACSASFDSGTLVSLAATAATGSTFTGWSGACTGTGACQVTMDGAKIVSAAFTLQRHALSVAKNGNGAGTVTSSPAGIDCGATCAQDWDHGTLVSLTPVPAAGSAFTGWSGACTGSGACSVTMDMARAVTATFTLQQHLLSVAKAGNGAGVVTSSPAGIDCGAACGENYDHGTVVTLSAAPSTDSVFAGWTGACAGTGECIVTMTDARSVTAAFTLKQFTLSVTRQGAGSGAVTSSPAGIDCGSDCSQAYDIGTAVSLTATPAPGSTFVGWSGSCAGSGACNVTMTSTRSAIATFALSGGVRGDANGDGKSDLFWRTAAPGTGLSWWTMNGAAVTAANYHDVDPAWQIADVGDLDGDGKADLVWRRASDGATYLWLLDGFAFKGFADLGVLDPAAWSLVGAADLNGDGKDDIVWRGVDGTVYAWLMNGGVIASQGVISNPGAQWVIADLADMDGDGKADIVFRNATDGGVYIYFMNGLSIASGGYVGAVDPAAWTLVGAADFSGDGKADFLWRHTSGDTWVWLMNGATFQAAGGIGNPGTSWSVRALGDFDGDGKADLVWRHTDGTTYLWKMNGTSVAAFLPIANPGGTWEVVAP